MFLPFSKRWITNETQGNAISIFGPDPKLPEVSGSLSIALNGLWSRTFEKSSLSSTFPVLLLT